MVFFQIGDLHSESPALKSSLPFFFVQSPHVDSSGWKKETERDDFSKKYCDDGEGEPEIEGLVHTHVLSQALSLLSACSNICFFP